MTDSIPKLDFLFSKITNVNFGFDAYVLIAVDGEDKSSGSDAPSPPTAGVSGPKLISASLPVTKQSYRPPVDVITKYFFIWSSAAAFPSPENFGDSVGFCSYGGQFSVISSINEQGFDFIHPPGANNSGFYSSIEAAQAAATTRNNDIFAENVAFYTIQWLIPGVPDGGDGGFAGFFADEITVTSPGVGAGSSSMTQNFLFGPFPAGAYGFSVTVGGSNRLRSGADAKLIFVSGGKVTSFSTLSGTTVADANDGGETSSLAVNVVVGKNERGSDSSVTVTSTGGGGTSV